MNWPRAVISALEARLSHALTEWKMWRKNARNLAEEDLLALDPKGPLLSRDELLEQTITFPVKEVYITKLMASGKFVSSYVEVTIEHDSDYTMPSGDHKGSTAIRVILRGEKDPEVWCRDRGLTIDHIREYDL